MSSRNLYDLHPDLFPKAGKLIKLLGEKGIDYMCYCTFRPSVEQDMLYKQGRTMPGKIVTYKKGGESLHNFTRDGRMASKAFDGVPLIGGKPLWSQYIMDTTGRRTLHPIWERVLEVGHGLGLESGQDWKFFKEACHWQLPVST